MTFGFFFNYFFSIYLILNVRGVICVVGVNINMVKNYIYLKSKIQRFGRTKHIYFIIKRGF